MKKFISYINSTSNYINQNRIKVISYLCIGLYLFIFNDQWIKFITVNWVDKIACSIDKTDFFVIIIAYYIIAIPYLLRNNIEKIAFHKFYFYIIAFSFHVFFLYTNTWYYYSFSDKYKHLTAWSNLFFIPCFLEFGKYMWLTHKLKHTKPAKPWFEVEDTKDYIDSYERNKMLTTIAKGIETTFFDDQSYAFAITGSWGSGKTSALHKIENILTENNQIKSILFFEPWKYDTSRSISNTFFTLLKKELDRYQSKISLQIDDYLVALDESIPTTLEKILKELYLHRSNKTTENTEYKALKSTLKDLKHKTLIFIDDVDRLDAEEIKTVLRIIRNTANLPFIQYVVAFDKEYVIKTLENDNLKNAREYLKKIFNNEFSLPSFEPTVIIDDLFRLNKEYICSYWNIDEYSLKDIINAYTRLENGNKRSILTLYLKNERDIIRFGNSLRLLSEIYKEQDLINDVEFESFFYIELLKYVDPDVHDILRDTPLKLLNINNRKYELLINKEVDNHESDLIPKFNYKRLEPLLQVIFRSNSLLSISDLNHYYNYFMFRLDKGAISQAELVGYIMSEDYTSLKDILSDKNEDALYTAYTDMLHTLNMNEIKDERSNNAPISKAIDFLLTTFKWDNFSKHDEVDCIINNQLMTFDFYTPSYLNLECYLRLMTSYLSFSESSPSFIPSILERILIKGRQYTQLSDQDQNDHVSLIIKEMYHIPESYTLQVSKGITKFLSENGVYKRYTITLEDIKKLQKHYLLNCQHKVTQRWFELLRSCIKGIVDKTGYENVENIRNEVLHYAQKEIKSNIPTFLSFFKNSIITPSDHSHDLIVLVTSNIFDSNEQFDNFLDTTKDDKLYSLVFNYWTYYKLNQYKHPNLTPSELEEAIDDNFESLLNKKRSKMLTVTSSFV